MKATWPIRWKNQSDLDWFYNALLVNDVRIWRCNTSPKDVKMFVSTEFDKLSTVGSIWHAWTTYNCKENLETTEEMLNTLIWGNSLIRRMNKPLFNKNLISSNIEKLIDIVDIHNRTLMSYDEVCSNFGPSLDHLFYLGIVAAITKFWKTAIRMYDFSTPLDLEDNIDYLSDKVRPSNLIYWNRLANTYNTTNSCKINLLSSLKIVMSDEDWWQIFPNFLKIIKLAKLRYFQYRLLVGGLTTNTKRVLWSNGTITNLCTFCNLVPETVLHMLCECDPIQQFWKKLKRIIAYYWNLEVLLDPGTIILNNYSGAQKEIVNLLVIIMKQHIYSEKCFNKTPTFQKYMNKLSMWFNIEKCIITTTRSAKKVDSFNKKWKQIF